MKSVVAVLAMVAALALSPWAEASDPVNGNPAIDALVDDIASGRRDSAIARISSIESISGRQRLVTTPTQFVDRLLGCVPKPALNAIADMTSVDWLCADGQYRTALTATFAPPYVTVAEFADPARLKENPGAPRIVAPPAPPRPGQALALPVPSQSALDLFSEAIRGKEPERFAGLVEPDGRVVFGKRDVVAKVTVTELDGAGSAAFTEQIAVARSRVGRIETVNCRVEAGMGICSVRSRTPQTGLVVMLWGDGDRIRSVQMMYVSP